MIVNSLDLLIFGQVDGNPCFRLKPPDGFRALLDKNPVTHLTLFECLFRAPLLRDVFNGAFIILDAAILVANTTGMLTDVESPAAAGLPGGFIAFDLITLFKPPLKFGARVTGIELSFEIT